MKKYKILILILIAAVFVVGFYFKDEVIKFYSGLGNQIQNVQKINVGSVVSEVAKNVSMPGPLNIGGSEQAVVLLQSKIISETNLQRQQNGNLSPLTENENLDEAAAAKANDMFVNQYFEHVSPSGIDPGELVQNYGYNYIVEGENLILGNFLSEKEVVQDWMNSPGHRANILNVRYTEIGVAIVKGTYKGESVWIGVQEFGLPLSACIQPNDVLKNSIDSDNGQLSLLSSQIKDKKSEIDSTSQDSPSYNQMINDYNQMISQYNSLADETKSNIAEYNSQVNVFNACVNGK